MLQRFLELLDIEMQLYIAKHISYYMHCEKLEYICMHENISMNVQLFILDFPFMYQMCLTKLCFWCSNIKLIEKHQSNRCICCHKTRTYDILLIYAKSNVKGVTI
jgi:hypothetical protein